MCSLFVKLISFYTYVHKRADLISRYELLITYKRIASILKSLLFFRYIVSIGWSGSVCSPLVKYLQSGGFWPDRCSIGQHLRRLMSPGEAFKRLPGTSIFRVWSGKSDSKGLKPFKDIGPELCLLCVCRITLIFERTARMTM